MADLQAVTQRHAYYRSMLRKLAKAIAVFPGFSNAPPARTAAHAMRAVVLAFGTVATLSACGHTLPEDPFDGEGEALTVVPINHTDRYAVDIVVDKYWAGNASRRADGGAAACCYPGLKDWSQPVTVKWTWGTEEDPKTKAITIPREPHTVVAHFPAVGPHSDPDPYKTDAYLCVILRDLNTAELAFSPSASGCDEK
jgi:hypothetical protein